MVAFLVDTDVIFSTIPELGLNKTSKYISVERFAFNRPKVIYWELSIFNPFPKTKQRKAKKEQYISVLKTREPIKRVQQSKRLPKPKMYYIITKRYLLRWKRHRRFERKSCTYIC